MLRKSNTFYSNRAFFYPNQKNTLSGNEELQYSNVTKRYLYKREIANSSFSKLPKLYSGCRASLCNQYKKFRYPKLPKRSFVQPFGFNTQIESNQHNKCRLRRLLSNCSRPVGPTELRALPDPERRINRNEVPCKAKLCKQSIALQAKHSFATETELLAKRSFANRNVVPAAELRSASEALQQPYRSERGATRASANDAHSAGVGQKALYHRWLLHNPRDISMQWIEKVGFTFSPFAFIFGTTFLFAALATTLQKQAGKQWLKTLSHTKLPGFYENKVSQKSSWVFLESVLSQYINKDNSLLASTTYFSKDAPYLTKLEKGMPDFCRAKVKTVPFRDRARGTRTFAKQKVELSKGKHSHPLQSKALQLYFGSFARSKSATGGLQSEALQAVPATQLPAERRQQPGCLHQAGIQIQLSPLWGHNLKKDFLGVFLGASSSTFGSTRLCSNLCSSMQSEALQNRNVVPVRQPLRRIGNWQKLGLSRSSEPSVNRSKIGRLPLRSLGCRALLCSPKRGLRKGFSYLTNYRRGFVKTTKLAVERSSAPDQSPLLPPELKTTLTLPTYKITAYHPTNCFIVPTWNQSTTTQVDRRLDRIQANPAKTKGTESIPFYSVNTGVERLRLEDDSIPAKKYSIYSKNKRHQDTLSARVLHVVKKSFYEYGLSIPCAAEPPTWVAAQLPSQIEVFGNFLSRSLLSEAEQGPELPEHSSSKPEEEPIPTKPLAATQLTSRQSEALQTPKRSLSAVEAQVWPQSGPESVRFSQGGYECGSVSMDLVPSAKSFLDSERLNQDSDSCSASLSNRKWGKKRLELGHIFKNIAIPQKSFWEYGHYISGYNFPELQDYEIADLFRSKVRFRHPRRALQMVASLQSKEGHTLAKLFGNFPFMKQQPFGLLLNEVFYTPYLVKIPPKVLLYVSNKTESISAQKTMPFTTLGGDSQSRKPLRSFRLLSSAEQPKVWRMLSEAEQAKIRGSQPTPPLQSFANRNVVPVSKAKLCKQQSSGKPTAQLEHAVGRESRAQVNNVSYEPAEPLVENSTIRYTPLDLKQENRVKKVFKDLRRDYSGYLKQPKDSLPALLLSPSLQEDKQIEEEEFKRLAQEKAAAKAAAKQTQNEEEYNTSDSATIEEESNFLDPLEGALREGKKNVNNLEEEPLNDEEIEDSKFERLRFTRELETKKDEEDCRGLALSLTPQGSCSGKLSSPYSTSLSKTRGLERVGQTELLLSNFGLQSEALHAKVRAHPPVQHGQPELCSANFVGARSNKPSKAEQEQELTSIGKPSVNQFVPKKLETKVSDRKHSFFGQRSFWPTRLFSQEERLVSAHVVNPYIRYDQRNPWLIIEQGGVLPFTTLHTKTIKSGDLQDLKNLQMQARLGLIRFVHFPLVALRAAVPIRRSGIESKALLSQSEALQGQPLVESALYTDQTRTGSRSDLLNRFQRLNEAPASRGTLLNEQSSDNQNRIYKPDPRLRLTPLESSLSGDWRNERKVEASPFRVTSKERIFNVLPKLSENQWQKSIEWQLKRHFLDEDTRLESLVATEPFKTFKIKKIERSLPWLTMAGTGEFSRSESVRLADSNLNFLPEGVNDPSCVAGTANRCKASLCPLWGQPELRSGNFAKQKCAKRSFASSEVPVRPTITQTHSERQETKIYDGSTERSKKPSFNLFQWPYKTVGLLSPLSLSNRGLAFSLADCATTTRLTAKCAPLVTCDKGVDTFVEQPISFFEDGFCRAWLNTVLPPFRLVNYSRIPLASSLTTYSKDSSALLSGSNSLFDVTKKLFSSQGDLNTELIFEVPSSCSWFLIYRLLLALILKEVLKYIYRISVKDFFIRIINSDFGQTVTSPEFRHKVQFSPFPEFYKPKNRLKDLIGIKNALLPLSEIIWFLRNNCRSRNGPHGVILLGPEGVDTTAIAQAVAGEANVPIIVQSLRALTLTHSHPQKRLEKVLLLARAKSPCVLFLDELDVIGQSREGVLRKTSGNENPLISLDSSQFASLSYPELHSTRCKASLCSEVPCKAKLCLQSEAAGGKHRFATETEFQCGRSESSGPIEPSSEVYGLQSEDLQPFWQSQSTKTLRSNVLVPQEPNKQSTSQGRRVDLMLRLLTVMDGLHNLNGVVIITTSKNTATLDPALLRPGRFDRIIHLTLPNHEQRMELFKTKTRAIFDRRLSLSTANPRGLLSEAEQGHTDNLSLHERNSLLSVDELQYLSLRTKNMSGADIVSAINYSTLRAIVNETVHTIETLEYGLNCVKALKASA